MLDSAWRRTADGRVGYDIYWVVERHRQPDRSRADLGSSNRQVDLGGAAEHLLALCSFQHQQQDELWFGCGVVDGDGGGGGEGGGRY